MKILNRFTIIDYIKMIRKNLKGETDYPLVELISSDMMVIGVLVPCATQLIDSFATFLVRKAQLK